MREYNIGDQKIKVKYMGQWTDFMSFQHFQDYYQERFPQIEALEIKELLTKEQFKKIYPRVTI